MESILSRTLADLADSYVPSPDFIKMGNESVQKVFELIQQSKHFSVDRTRIGGSVGKSLSLHQPDYDILVFVNGEFDPSNRKERRSKLGQLKQLLGGNNRELLGLLPKKDGLKSSRSSYVLCLNFKNGIKVDLLLAKNFNQNPKIQYELVLKEIKKTPRNFSAFSGSLVETQMDFFGSQPSATHQLIRLVKHWYKGLGGIDAYGGKYLIEVICVSVCYKNLHDSLYEKVIKAFQAIKDLKTLKIAFRRDLDGNWKLLEGKEATRYIAEFRNVKRRNFVMDPSNPFNNLLHSTTKKFRNELAICAGQMKADVEALMKFKGEQPQIYRSALYLFVPYIPVPYIVK